MQELILVLVLQIAPATHLLFLNHQEFTYCYHLLSYPLFTHIFQLLCPALCCFPAQLDFCLLNIAVTLCWSCAQQKRIPIQEMS